MVLLLLLCCGCCVQLAEDAADSHCCRLLGEGCQVGTHKAGGLASDASKVKPALRVFVLVGLLVVNGLVGGGLVWVGVVGVR
jgi:hypothetical protein